MSKTKTMTLIYPVPNTDPLFVSRGESDVNNRVYRITKVTDTTEYAPGKTLLRREVDELCASSAWKVTITEVPR